MICLIALLFTISPPFAPVASRDVTLTSPPATPATWARWNATLRFNQQESGQQQNGEQQNGEKPSHGKDKHAKKEPVVQSFTGTVEWAYRPLSWDCDTPNCDHFALYDDATHMNYDLDDARVALPFEGKRAKVIGVMDTKNSVIHVLRIEALKQ